MIVHVLLSFSSLLVLHPPPETLQLVHPHLRHEAGARLLPADAQIVLQHVVQVSPINCLRREM